MDAHVIYKIIKKVVVVHYNNTRGPVHELLHGCSPSAWPGSGQLGLANQGKGLQ